MTYTRRALILELQAMLPGSRGRHKIEQLLQKLTVAELVSATGIKPRFRVKALRSPSLSKGA
jgi:hypothetical protein